VSDAPNTRHRDARWWLRRLLLVLVLGGGLAIGTAGVALADNCSGPGDCEETAGYNGVIAVVGGIAAVAAAAAAAVQHTPPGEKTDLGIVQVNPGEIEVGTDQDGQVIVTAWHVGETGVPKRAGFPLSIEVVGGAPLSVTPAQGDGQIVATVRLVGEPTTDTATLICRGIYKGEASANVTVRLEGGYELEIY
jgi:hypothetical protein